MRYVIFALFCFLGTTVAKADTFQTLVGYHCSQSSSQVVITYQGASDKAGGALLKNAGPNEWNPWDLVQYDQNGMLKHQSVISRSCHLRGTIYTVKISPSLYSGNIQGQCGDAINAHVTVSIRNKMLVDTSFESMDKMGHPEECQNDDPVITRISITSPKNIVEIIRIPHEKFYE